MAIEVKFGSVRLGKGCGEESFDTQLLCNVSELKCAIYGGGEGFVYAYTLCVEYDFRYRLRFDLEVDSTLPRARLL